MVLAAVTLEGTVLHVRIAGNPLEQFYGFIQILGVYVGSLSGASRSRYEGKVLSAGLKIDPYAINDSHWSNEPELIPIYHGVMLCYIWFLHPALILKRLSK